MSQEKQVIFNKRSQRSEHVDAIDEKSRDIDYFATKFKLDLTTATVIQHNEVDLEGFGTFCILVKKGRAGLHYSHVSYQNRELYLEMTHMIVFTHDISGNSPPSTF